MADNDLPATISQREVDELKRRLADAQAQLESPLAVQSIGQDQVIALQNTAEELKGVINGLAEKVEEQGRLTREELTRKEREAIGIVQHTGPVRRSTVRSFLERWDDACAGRVRDESGGGGGGDTDPPEAPEDAPGQS